VIVLKDIQTLADGALHVRASFWRDAARFAAHTRRPDAIVDFRFRLSPLTRQRFVSRERGGVTEVRVQGVWTPEALMTVLTWPLADVESVRLNVVARVNQRLADWWRRRRADVLAMGGYDGRDAEYGPVADRAERRWAQADPHGYRDASLDAEDGVAVELPDGD
jgi:hypothetical protein